MFASAAVAAGLASAQTTPTGTGAVVIDTNLGYQGGQAAGTGMVLTSSGEILTNNHVIRGATSIKVTVPGTGHSYVAKVVGYDLTGDVAVLQATGATDLKTIATDGSASGLKVGESVTAVGNAGGTGSLTSSTGTVTALGRAITVSDDQYGSESLAGLVETNAPLQPGDSGGPLLDAADKAIAMDTAAELSNGYSAGSTGPGYAIPINKALAIARQIESRKASTAVHVGGTAFLGVELAVLLRTPPGGSTAGAPIEDVTPGGPAAGAGLVGGDTITAIGGRTVSSPTALGALILSKKPGARVSVKYVDQAGVSVTASVRLASGPPQ